MKIPMLDLKQQYLQLKEQINTGIQQALEDTQFILGPNVQAFEKEAADYLGVKHTVGLASGTDALHLALVAAGIGDGDEVITTPFTFIATAEAIRYVGARPVFVDIDARTFNIDIEQIEQIINEKTKAIIPVHIFGQPVDMPRLQAIAQKYSLKLIEDCAQSFGAHINHKMTGSYGDLGAFSFFPSKNLGCFGDGGLISTNSDELAEKVRMLRNHGSAKRYHHSLIGYNSRLDELQAVILRIKLKHIDSYNTNRRRVDQAYKALLSDTDIQMPFEDGIGYHVYHQYTLLHPDRKSIMNALQNAGIASAIYYPIPLHKQEVFINEYQDKNFPNAEFVANNCFSIPIYPELDDDKIEFITSTIKQAAK